MGDPRGFLKIGRKPTPKRDKPLFSSSRFTGSGIVSSVHLPIEQEHAYLWTKTECLHTAKLIRRALLKRRAPA